MTSFAFGSFLLKSVAIDVHKLTSSGCSFPQHVLVPASDNTRTEHSLFIDYLMYFTLKSGT